MHVWSGGSLSLWVPPSSCAVLQLQRCRRGVRFHGLFWSILCTWLGVFTPVGVIHPGLGVSPTDYSSDVPHTQTSQAALDRVSFPPTSRSQSSSFHQNVPHVQDYSEPGPSRTHPGDQSADDFLVFQDDNECNDEYEEADYSNDDGLGQRSSSWVSSRRPSLTNLYMTSPSRNLSEKKKTYQCPHCDKEFFHINGLSYHQKAEHLKITFQCVCGKVYKHRPSMVFHWKTCPIYQASKKT